MQVRDLIEKLQQFDPRDEVKIEINAYNNLIEIDDVKRDCCKTIIVGFDKFRTWMDA